MFKAPRKTFSDILNWDAAIASGVVLCKDGSFIAGWDITGIDTESLPDEIIAVETAKIARAIAGFGRGYTFWTDFKRVQKEVIGDSEEEFDKPALRFMQAERNALLAEADIMYQNTITLTVQYHPDKFEGTDSDTLKLFTKVCNIIGDRFGTLYQMRRLELKEAWRPDGTVFAYDELISYLGLCVDGQWRHPKLAADPFPAYLDVMLRPEWVQETWDTLPRVNGRHTAVISLDGFPPYTDPRVLECLELLPLTYHVSHRFSCFGATDQKKSLIDIGRFWEQTRKSLFDQAIGIEDGRIDRHADDMHYETEAAVSDVTGSDVSYGSYNGIVTLTGPHGAPATEVLAAANHVIETLLEFGVEARIETVNALAAFIGRLPGHRDKNPRRPFISSLNYADFVPVSTIWSGEERSPNPFLPKNSPALLIGRSKGGEPFWFNLHSKDVGHTLILGPTGAGKSVLLGLIAANFCKYKDSQIIAFDKKRSLQSLTLAVGGAFLPIGTEGRALAPMSGITDLGRAWATNWVKTLCQMKGVDLTPETQKEISDAVKSLASLSAPTLSHLEDLIQDKQIRYILEEYTSGSLKGFFDASADDLDWADWTVFETDDLFNSDEVSEVLALDYLFKRIESRLHGRPTLIILDEAWAFLESPLFADKIKSWLKELRKANAAVVIATHSIADAVNSPILPILTESCKTKIFLPNPDAATTRGAEHYSTLGLTDAQIAVIAAGEQKQDYFILKPEGQRMVDFMVGAGQLALIGRTSLTDSADAEQLYETNPGFWKARVQAAYTESHNSWET